VSELRKVYFVLRADEKGPPSGPTLNPYQAQQWAESEPDETPVVEVLASVRSTREPAPNGERWPLP
jgi:hypothetical protein